MAIGDDGNYQTKKARKNEEGGIDIDPPNFLTSPVKKGTGADAYFSSPSFTSIDDQYKDPKFMMRYQTIEERKNFEKVADKAFKPGGTVSKIVTPAYEYIE